MSHLRDAWDRYDDTGESTIVDLVNDVETLVAEGKVSITLQKAVDAFREEQREDLYLGGRGDMDTAEEAFVNAVRAALSAEEGHSELDP